jgi:hypothetical protein
VKGCDGFPRVVPVRRRRPCLFVGRWERIWGLGGPEYSNLWVERERGFRGGEV